MKKKSGAVWLENLNRDEWLLERQKSLGASDVATVLGLNKFQTPLQLWRKMMGQTPPQEETETTKLGHLLEPTIAQLYEDETKRQVVDMGIFLVRRDFIHATPDRLFIETKGDNDTQGVLELKNVGGYMFKDWENDVPLYVQCQVQVQIYCCDMQTGSVAALLAGTRFAWQDIPRHDSFIAYMLKQCAEFWERVQDGHAPTAEARDTKTLYEMYPEHRGDLEPKLLPAALADETDVLEGLEATKKEAEDQIAEIKNLVKQELGDHEVGILPDGRRWKWSTEHVAAAEKPRAAFSKRVLRRVKA